MIQTTRSRLVCTLSSFIMAMLLVPLTAHAEGGAVISQQSDEDRLDVQGTVTDASGIPLVGASVAEQGTLNGTVTDLDGKFSLAVRKGAVIEVSSIGFKTVSFTADSSAPQTIVLQEDAELLEATVVTALGIKRSRKALNYNVQEVSSSDVTTVRDVNFVNALSGKVAGVTINASSSGVGGESQVIMRGSKSISQGNGALYVIDGVPIFTTGGSGGTGFQSSGRVDPMSDINPEPFPYLQVLPLPLFMAAMPPMVRSSSLPRRVMPARQNCHSHPIQRC